MFINKRILWEVLEDLFDYLDLEYPMRIYLRSLAAGLGISLTLVLLSKLYIRWYEKQYNITPKSNTLPPKNSVQNKIVRYRGGILPAGLLAGIYGTANFVKAVGIILGGVASTGVGLRAIHQWDKLDGLSEFLKYTTPQSMHSYMEIERARKSARALIAVREVLVFAEACRRMRIFKYLMSQISSSKINLESKKEVLKKTFQSKTFLKVINDNRGLATFVVCISTLIQFIYHNERDLYFSILENLIELVKQGKMKLIVLRAIVRLLRRGGVPVPLFLEEFIEEIEENIQNLKPA